MDDVYLIRGQAYTLEELVELSGKRKETLLSIMESGATPGQAILPRKYEVDAKGVRKRLLRDENEMIEWRGETKAIFDWAMELKCPTGEVLQRMKSNYLAHTVRKIYRVRYYLYFKDRVELRFTSVPETDLKKFLYTHIFSRVTGESEMEV